MKARDDTFDQYAEMLLGAEGVYSDHPADRGGKTQFGISERFLASIGRGGEKIDRAEAIRIYRQYFWNANRCAEMHPLVAWCACDAFVQHPPRSAALMIQVALDVEADGIIGPNTIEAAKAPNPAVFWPRYRLERIRFYNDIVSADPSQQAFVAGWHDRLHRLADALHEYGLLGSYPEKRESGVTRIATGPGAKATGLGLVAGSAVAFLQWLGFDPSGIQEWVTQAIAPGGLIALVVAWAKRSRPE